MKPIELRNHLKKGGISFMLVTPFDENGGLLLEAYKRNIESLLERIEGFENCTITPCGSNGELAHLSEDEAKAVIRTCVETVGHRAVVIAGTGRPSTHETVELSRYAEAVGADGIQVILPYYFIPTEQGVFKHYEAIVRAVEIGMVIYNNPAFAASWIRPELMRRMIDEFGGDGRIAGVKENTPHIMLFDKMAQALEGTEVALYSGFGEEWYKYQFAWGADGFATPFGNFCPEYPIRVYQAAQCRDFKALGGWIRQMKPYYTFVGKCSAKRRDAGILGKPGGSIYGEGNVRFGIIKEAMNLAGMEGGRMRLPLTMLEENERTELGEILSQLGLITQGGKRV